MENSLFLSGFFEDGKLEEFSIDLVYNLLLVLEIQPR